ncbi:uncharacterized protein [Parasteatoda tepidariorum]|uniref:uncharacterized protein n=1 Tax=Parasteatoda tepidariorum TaxID=114398 RepID=UPI00077FA719|nr:uncharacterized protein LOC107443624 [Parasteatoda tepidariorum]
MNELHTFAFFLLMLSVSTVHCQQQAPYDFGEQTRGEREGELSPVAIAGVAFLAVAVVAGLGVTILFCYYVHRKQRQELYAAGAFLASNTIRK